MTDECGHIKNDGDPCTFTAKYPDGKCGHHTEADEPIDTGQDGPGRPTKLTKERQERIATAIEEGVPLVAACRLNDITHQTHSNWMERGEDQDEGIYAEYFGRLTRALGHDQSEKTKKLWDAAEKANDTGTMLTILKQRYPETWADTDIGEAGGVRQQIPDELVEAWYGNNR
jgi:hypothetical protein